MIETMEGEGAEPAERGVSTLVGIVLLVALTMVGAMLVVSVGGMALDTIRDQTNEDVSRDAFRETSSRLSALAEGSTNGSTKLKLPEQGEGSLSVAQDATVRVWASNESSSEACTVTTDVGTLKYEGESGDTLAYQGGGVWKRTDDGVTMLTPPELDRNGNRLELSLTNVTAREDIRDSKEVVASMNTTGSSSRSEAMTQALSTCWTNATGTVTVDVNVTITSEYAAGWARYGNRSLNTTRTEYDAETDTVELYFDTLGANTTEVPDGAASDTDGDGISDLVENESEIASDSDGRLDFNDTDADGDGIYDADEADPDGDTTNEFPDAYGADSKVNYNDSDSDTDGDGIDDAREVASLGDYHDSDDDGRPDYNETDSDDDGIPDAVETNTSSFRNADGDGVPDHRDTDSDDDGLLDGTEADPDGDGDNEFPDSETSTRPVNYNDSDSDGDGIADYDEADPDGDGTLEWPDNDTTDGSHLNYNDSDSDYDGDGITDGTEADYRNATNHNLSTYDDADGDGTPDWQASDADGDGISDRLETNTSGTFRHSDADGVPDHLDTDTDGDGLDDRTEVTVDASGDVTFHDSRASTQPVDYNASDSDGDGILDGDEVDPDGDGTLEWPDNDSDGTPNYNQSDSDYDDDRIPDRVEANYSAFNDSGGVVGSYTFQGTVGVYDVSDTDSKPDWRDTDADDDGTTDDGETNLVATGLPDFPNADGDGLPDFQDSPIPDADGDGVPDSVENVSEDASDGDGRLDYNDTDADGDGIYDADETDPDGDGDNEFPDAYGGDNKVNYNDSDSDTDGDTILDSREVESEGVYYDSDGDGTPDYNETDSDDDGVPDATETNDDTSFKNSDSDGVPDHRDNDSDGDGIPDGTEADPDSDGDTELFNNDTDGLVNYNDTDSDDDGIADADEADPDGDGTLEWPDSNASDTHVDYNDSDSDYDGDGIPDGVETDHENATNHNLSTYDDADGDGIPDWQESDSDGDGIPDSTETDPDGDLINEFPDSDGDGVPNYKDTDSDDDGIADGDEADPDGDGTLEWPDGNASDGLVDYNDSDSDADGDGIRDGVEADFGNDNPAGVYDDSDADGDANYRESDSDGDGLPDSVEADFDGNNSAVSFDDADGDGMPDYMETDSDDDGTTDDNETNLVNAGVPDYPDGDADGLPDYRDSVGSDADDDGVAGETDDCPATLGNGTNGCHPIGEDGDELVVNQSEANVTVLATKVGETNTTSVEVPAAYRKPMDVMFTIDISGSMSSNDPEDKRIDAVRNFTGELNTSRGDRAGVVEFTEGNSWDNWDYEDIDPTRFERRYNTSVDDLNETSWTDLPEDHPWDQARDGGYSYFPAKTISKTEFENRYGVDYDDLNEGFGAEPTELPDDAKYDGAKADDGFGPFEDQVELYNKTVQVRMSDATVHKHTGLTGDLGQVNGSVTGAALDGTDIAAGINESVDEYRANGSDDHERVMVLLSDGKHNGEGKLDGAARYAADNNITIYTVGLGSDVDPRLPDVSNETGGSHYHVDNAEGLESIFDQIAREAKNESIRRIENREVRLSAANDTGSHTLEAGLMNPNVSDESMDTNYTLNETLGENGDNIWFDATVDRCSSADETGINETHPNGTTYQHVECHGDASTTTVSTGEGYAVYTDNETFDPTGTQWWQEPPERFFESAWYDEGTNRFDLAPHEAVVVMNVTVGGQPGYTVMFVDTGGSSGSDSETDESEPAEPTTAVTTTADDGVSAETGTTASTSGSASPTTVGTAGGAGSGSGTSASTGSTRSDPGTAATVDSADGATGSGDNGGGRTLDGTENADGLEPVEVEAAGEPVDVEMSEVELSD